MGNYTTDPARPARSARRAPGNSFYERKPAPTCYATPAPPRRCAVCGADISARRAQTRTCGPRCRGRLFDARHNRQKHVNEGKRAGRAVRS